MSRLPRTRRKPPIQWDKLRSIPIVRVAEKLKIKTNAAGIGHCPFPRHSDANPSFSISKQRNMYKCFGCGRAGSVLDLVKDYFEVDIRQAAEWLSAEFIGGNTIKLYPPPRNRAEPNDSGGEPDPEIYRWLIDQSPLRDDGLEYLLARKISESTIRKFEIGQVQNISSLIAKAISIWGENRVQRSGLTTSVASNRFNPVFTNGYILFPFFNGRDCSYLQARAIRSEEPRWKCLARVKPRIFNQNVLSGPARRSIYICEGLTDVLSAAELGYDAIGLLGASSSMPRPIIDALRGKFVHLIPDQDAAGARMGQRLQQELAQHGISVVVQELPPGCKDINELLGRKDRGRPR